MFRALVLWGIILGIDPLAVEMSAICSMNEKRALEKVDPLPLPEYLKIAENK